MKIAIAGDSPIELAAVEEAWKVFGSRLAGRKESFDFVRYGVPGDVRGLPLSTDDLLKQARTRVENLILQLKREKNEADYYVGFATGFDVVESQGPRRLAFLTNVAYVTDGHRSAFGRGPSVLLPRLLADPVIDRGIDLAIALDRYAAQVGQSPESGEWGLLTHEIISTQHALLLAVLTAFAPFYNAPAFEGG
ncbi:MAG: hypothetical protein Kow00109_15280 [Acidobacteriota bacterium]